MSGLLHRVHRAGDRVVVELFTRPPTEAKARALVDELLAAGEVAELQSIEGSVTEWSVTRDDRAPAVWT